MINKFIIFMCLFGLLSMVHARPNCTRRVAGVDEGVCPVSLYALIVNGNEFNNRMVVVTGFFAYGDIPIVFSSRDLFEASSVSDGITIVLPDDREMVSRLYSLNHSYIEVVGRFSTRGSDTSSYYGLETAGSLSHIRWVSRADRPWGYSEPTPPKHLRAMPLPQSGIRKEGPVKKGLNKSAAIGRPNDCRANVRHLVESASGGVRKGAELLACKKRK